jgi:transcriptional regulator with XRE-family HTH domain
MLKIGLDWIEEVNRLREPGQSDAGLAAALGVSRQLLSAVFRGDKEFSTKLKASIWGRLESDRELDADAALAFLSREKAEVVLADYAEFRRNQELVAGSPLDMTDAEALRDLQTLKQRRGLNDAELAAELGIDDTYVSQLLSGKVPVSFNVKRKVWGRLKYDLNRDRILWFLSREKAEAVIEADRARGRRRVAQAVEKRAKRAEAAKRAK